MAFKRISVSAKRFAAIGGCALSLSIASAQLRVVPTDSPQIKKIHKVFTLNRTELVKPRPPLAFKAFPTNIDPTTGNPASANQMVKLPSGKSITVYEFWRQMNALEQMANAKGYTIKDLTTEKLPALVPSDLVPKQAAATVFSRPTPATLKLIGTKLRRAAFSAPQPPPKPTIKLRTGPTLTGPVIKTNSVPIYSPTPIPIWSPTAGEGVTTTSTMAFAGIQVINGKMVINKPITNPPPVNDPAVPPPPPATAPTTPTTIYVEQGPGNSGPDHSYLPFATSASVNWTIQTFEIPNAAFYHYIFQVVDTDMGSGFANYGWQNWQSPNFMVATGDWWLDPSINVNYQQIDFGKFMALPQGDPSTFHHYAVRLIPTDLLGDLLGLPSAPVTISYGYNPNGGQVLNIAPPPPPNYVPTNRGTQTYQKTFGDQNIMGVYINGSLNETGDTTHRSIQGTAAAGVSLLGNAYDILYASAGGQFSLPSSFDPNSTASQASVSLDVEVLGQSILPVSTGSASGFNQQVVLGSGNLVDLPMNVSFQQGIPVGPFDISITAQFGGDLGMGAALTGETGGVSGPQFPMFFSVTPHANVSASCAGAIGIGIDGFDIVSVGANVTVNILQADSSLNLSSGGNFSYTLQDCILCSGDIDAFVKIGAWIFSKEWDITICSWPGDDLCNGNPVVLFQGGL